MTIQELNKKIASLQISLEFMRHNQEDLIKQIGRWRYEDLLNEVLDQYIYYSNLLKNTK